MPRFLTIFGSLLGTGGVLAGALFVMVRYGVYVEALRVRRGPFAPTLWQLSLGSGTLVITLSALFGFLLFMLGRTLARVERLELTLGEAPSPGDLELSAGRHAADVPAVMVSEGTSR